MDPITGAVIALVFWFFIRSVVSVALVFAGMGLGVLLAALFDNKVFVAVGMVLGWLAALAFEVFAVIQMILEIVRIVEILNT
jgi:hypothetical protein